jgi:N-acetylmuramoyl-L-alanine amidase
MTLLRTILFVAVFFTALAGLAGCDHEVSLDWGMKQAYSPPPEPIQPTRTSLTRLAEELELTVIQNGPDIARLQNAANTVTLFADPYGAVYVNGDRLSAGGRIDASGGVMFVPVELASRIRPRLRTARPHATRTIQPRIIREKPQWLATVVLDAGHGGKDPGAMSPAGDREADIVLDVVRRAASLLQQRGIKVLLTRDNDTFVELDDRVSFANRHRPELFVSVHADAALNTKAQGFTVFVPRRESPESASQRLGDALSRRLEAVAAVSRGVRRHELNLRVLENTRTPAVLVELGFMSNSRERALLLQPEYRKRLAMALADGIETHLEAR